MRALLSALARRLLLGVLVLWGAATLSFLMLSLLPGDPVDTILGPESSPSPELRERITAEYGFDQPLTVQYAGFLARLATLDLGFSYQLRQPVADVLAVQAWPTLQLALAASALAVVMAVVGAVSTAGGGRWLRSTVSGAELVVSSVPVFWVGLLLISVFSFHLGWFPAAGDRGAASLVLPALTLALPFAGVLAQVLREHLELALREPFAMSARARGLNEVSVRLRHALRHAAVPGVTLAGWMLGSLFTGTVLVETVFARPGLGHVTVSAVLSRDMPVVTAIVVATGAVFVAINLVTDLLYSVLDPRLSPEVAR